MISGSLFVIFGGTLYHPLISSFSICGTLHSVDQFLNIKLTDISVTDPEKYPHMVSIRNSVPLLKFLLSGFSCQ